MGTHAGVWTEIKQPNTKSDMVTLGGLGGPPRLSLLGFRSYRMFSLLGQERLRYGVLRCAYSREFFSNYPRHRSQHIELLELQQVLPQSFFSMTWRVTWSLIQALTRDSMNCVSPRYDPWHWRAIKYQESVNLMWWSWCIRHDGTTVCSPRSIMVHRLWFLVHNDKTVAVPDAWRYYSRSSWYI